MEEIGINTDSSMGVEKPEQGKPEISSPASPEPSACKEINNNNPSAASVEKSVVVVVQSSSSPQQSPEFESQTEAPAAVSSPDHDLFDRTIQDLQKMECKNPSRKGTNRRKSCDGKCEENRGEIVGGRLSNCAAGFAGDCAAVCCCPCALVHVFALALVKVPFVFAKKGLRSAKKKALTNKMSDPKKNEEKEKKPAKSTTYSPLWSFASTPPNGSPRSKVDSEKMWKELYAAGHIGFGGAPFERD